MNDQALVSVIADGEITPFVCKEILKRCATCDDKVLAIMAARYVIHDIVMKWGPDDPKDFSSPEAKAASMDRANVLGSTEFKEMMPRLRHLLKENPGEKGKPPYPDSPDLKAYKAYLKNLTLWDFWGMKRKVKK